MSNIVQGRERITSTGVVLVVLVRAFEGVDRGGEALLNMGLQGFVLEISSGKLSENCPGGPGGRRFEILY